MCVRKREREMILIIFGYKALSNRIVDFLTCCIVCSLALYCHSVVNKEIAACANFRLFVCDVRHLSYAPVSVGVLFVSACSLTVTD